MKTWAKMNKVPYPQGDQGFQKEVYAIGLFAGKRACLFSRDYKLITTYATPIAKKMIAELSEDLQTIEDTKLGKESYPEGYPKKCDILYLIFKQTDLRVF